MKKHFIFAALLVLPTMVENAGCFLFAGDAPHSSMQLRGGAYSATPLIFQTEADINQSTVPASPLLWGMDTAWDSEDNVVRGTNYITKDALSIGRVSFQPSDLVDAEGNLSAAQQVALQSRLNHIAISGVRNVILNCDHEALNSTNYYGKPEEWYKVIKASVKYIRAKGFNVITVSPFNEPDYTPWGEGTMSHFREIARLISEDAVETLKKELLPLATVITPNIPEAEVLSGMTIQSEEDMVTAAKTICEDYGCSVLCKGGHKLNDANDLLVQKGQEIRWFMGKRIDNPNTHGTGCTLSSAIASNLAKGYSLEEAVEYAKNYISGALAAMLDLGVGSGPMNHAFAVEGSYEK